MAAPYGLFIQLIKTKSMPLLYQSLYRQTPSHMQSTKCRPMTYCSKLEWMFSFLGIRLGLALAASQFGNAAVLLQSRNFLSLRDQ